MRKVTLDGQVSTLPKLPGDVAILGIACDARGNIYACNYNSTNFIFLFRGEIWEMIQCQSDIESPVHFKSCTFMTVYKDGIWVEILLHTHWEPNLHSQMPIHFRCQIKTLMLLARFGKGRFTLLPKDILFIVFNFMLH